MQEKNKYVYVVTGADEQPCRAFTSREKALDYVFALKLLRNKYGFDDFDFPINKITLE